MESKARWWVNIYQKSIIGISIVHITSFAYMTFCVEWIGWDIIEPITYSIDQFILLLGMIFYYRYGINRENASMLKASL